HDSRERTAPYSPYWQNSLARLAGRSHQLGIRSGGVECAKSVLKAVGILKLSSAHAVHVLYGELL
ncbi:MAG: hypothetical protein ABJ349_01445, partial [Hyphomicrobiales bacterium]